MQKTNPKEELREPQEQSKPGLESKMKPVPKFDDPELPGYYILIFLMSLFWQVLIIPLFEQ
jgi:hypothetical protein